MKGKEKEFNISEWRFDQRLKELEGEDSAFSIDPKLAHKIWEVIQSQMQKIDSTKDSDANEYTYMFLDAFPTASGFFHFLNGKLKGLKEEYKGSDWDDNRDTILNMIDSNESLDELIQISDLLTGYIDGDLEIENKSKKEIKEYLYDIIQTNIEDKEDIEELFNDLKDHNLI